jgi:hypothetical protein
MATTPILTTILTTLRTQASVGASSKPETLSLKPQTLNPKLKNPNQVRLSAWHGGAPVSRGGKLSA